MNPEVERQNKSSTLYAGNFATLSVLHLSSPSHLLPSSCSPDKDLFLTISRLGIKDTISLWKMQGPSKKWEVDVSVGNAAQEEVTGVAWSPDGMSILISHHPPRLSIHSIQDGRQECSVAFPPGTDFRVTGVWWHKYQKPPTNEPQMPDFFKRNKTIPGSALSQLKMQPLLDPLKDDTQPITTSDLFSFQGTLPTSTAKAPKLPDSIADWPALPLDLITASIKPVPRPGDPQRRPGGPPEEVLDDVGPQNSLNYDSVVFATDDRCRVHFFLDATFPLGHLALASPPPGVTSEVTSLFHAVYGSTLLAHVTHRANGQGHTNRVPLGVDLAPLHTPQVRAVACASSATRELVWYMLRAVAEMRTVWMGAPSQGEGARVLGPRWVAELEEKQRAHIAWKDPLPIVDLTLLLTTGRASDALSDLLVGLSERGLSKWDATMTEAFTKLRDYAEKRIALVAQRLHLLLHEAKGWAMLPQMYAVHRFEEAQVDRCLGLVNRAIVLSAWLAATAREQLWRFKEFKLWLQYELSRVHTDEGKVRPLSWDVLEVNRYLQDGLAECALDKWFDGADAGENRVPELTPVDVRAPMPSKPLSRVIAEARRAVDDSSVLRTEYGRRERPGIEHLDRNLEQLVKEIAQSCRAAFNDSGTGVAETAAVYGTWPAPTPPVPLRETRLRCTRERTTIENGLATQYVLSCAGDGRVPTPHLCLTRMQFRMEMPPVVQCVQVAQVACRVLDTSPVAMEVLDYDFFDDEALVLALTRGDVPLESGEVFLVTAAYRELAFVQVEGGVEEARESLVKGSGGATQMLPVTGSRKLIVEPSMTGEGDGLRLSVNGRVGRRTVCVLDGRGTMLEVVDMAEEEGEE